MIVSYVIVVSIAWIGCQPLFFLDPIKGLSRDRKNVVITDHSHDQDQCTIRFQRHIMILDRSPARSGPP